MFFIVGFGNQTSEEYGVMPEQLCGRCRNQTARPLTKITSWFSLFFIPLIPYKSRYLLVCPICNDQRELDKYEFEDLKNTFSFSNSRRNYDENKEGGDANGDSGSGRNKGFGLSNFSPHTRNPEPDIDMFAGKNERQIAFLKKMQAAEKSKLDKEA